MRPGLSLKLNQTLTHRKSTLTLSVAALLILAMLAYGPILQPDGYHAFADQRHWLDIANSADVLSNIGFFLVGAWALLRLLLNRTRGGGRDVTAAAYALFFIALILTAFG